MQACGHSSQNQQLGCLTTKPNAKGKKQTKQGSALSKHVLFKEAGS